MHIFMVHVYMYQFMPLSLICNMTLCSQDSCDCVTCVCCSRRWKTLEQQLQKRSHRSAERCFLLRSHHHTLLIAFSSLYLFYVSLFIHVAICICRFVPLYVKWSRVMYALPGRESHTGRSKEKNRARHPGESNLRRWMRWLDHVVRMDKYFYQNKLSTGKSDFNLVDQEQTGET